MRVSGSNISFGNKYLLKVNEAVKKQEVPGRVAEVAALLNVEEGTLPFGHAVFDDGDGHCDDEPLDTVLDGGGHNKIPVFISGYDNSVMVATGFSDAYCAKDHWDSLKKGLPERPDDLSENSLPARKYKRDYAEALAQLHTDFYWQGVEPTALPIQDEVPLSEQLNVNVCEDTGPFEIRKDIEISLVDAGDATASTDALLDGWLAGFLADSGADLG